MSRTLLTSLTTLVVVVVLYWFGGADIKDFAFALIVGVAVGTYSSIFVASPVILLWDKVFGSTFGAGGTDKDDDENRRYISSKKKKKKKAAEAELDGEANA